MQIRVRLFATLRQLAGWAQQPLDLPGGATVADALAELDRHAIRRLTVGKRTIYVAVNQEYAQGARRCCRKATNLRSFRLSRGAGGQSTTYAKAL